MSFATRDKQLKDMMECQPPPRRSDGSLMAVDPVLYHIAADQLMLWDKCQRTTKTRAKMCRGPQQVDNVTGKHMEVQSETIMNVIHYPLDVDVCSFTPADVAQLKESMCSYPPQAI